MSANRIIFSKYQFVRLMELGYSVLYDLQKKDSSNPYLRQVCSDIEKTARQITETTLFTEHKKIGDEYKALVATLKLKQQAFKKTISGELKSSDSGFVGPLSDVVEMKKAQAAINYVLKIHLIPPFDPALKPLLMNKTAFQNQLEKIILKRRMQDLLDEINTKFSSQMDSQTRFQFVNRIVKRIQKHKLWFFPQIYQQYVDELIKLVDSETDRVELSKYEKILWKVLSLNVLIRSVDDTDHKSLNAVSVTCLFGIRSLQSKFLTEKEKAAKYKSSLSIMDTASITKALAGAEQKSPVLASKEPERKSVETPSPSQGETKTDTAAPTPTLAPTMEKEKQFLAKVYQELTARGIKISENFDSDMEDWQHQEADIVESIWQPGAFISKPIDLRQFIKDSEILIGQEDSTSSLEQIKEALIEPLQKTMGLTFDVVLDIDEPVDNSYDIVKENRILEKWFKRPIYVRLIVVAENVTQKLVELNSKIESDHHRSSFGR